MKRRLVTLSLVVASILACVAAYAVCRYKASALLVQRLERMTGHRVTIGGVGLSLRLDLVARDVSIAGAPPFESRVLAHADRVAVHFRGPEGFWSVLNVVVDGLELEYLGTAAGDNLFGVQGSDKLFPHLGRSPAATASPGIVVRGARLRGSIAPPFGPHLEFRVPQADLDHSPGGTTRAVLRDATVEAQGWATFRAKSLEATYQGGQLRLSTGGPATVEIPGGGTWLDRLILSADVSGPEANLQLKSEDGHNQRFVLTGQWRPQTAEISLQADDLSLRAFGFLAGMGAPADRRALGLEDGKASLGASLVVDRQTLTADYQLGLKLAGIDLLHPGIDVVPWRNHAGSLSLRGRVDFASARVEISEGSLSAFAARLGLTGWIDLARSPRGALTLATPKDQPLRCAALLWGQAKPVKDVLAGLELEGSLGLSVAVEFDAGDWEDLKLDIEVDPLCRVTREPQVLANLLPALRDADAALAVSTGLPLGTFHPDFIPLAYMSRHVPNAFVTAEDSQFFSHHGFDPEMIRAALAQDLENGSFDRGASTITQQLAKNLFLSHQRTLARKLEEAVLTWRLDSLLERERILELYLNIIELGPGIRGVKQAARAYFTRGISNVTPLEAVYLAALTPNPHVLSRRFREGKVDEGWRQRLFDLLGSMRRHGRLTSEELAEARASKLVLRDRSLDPSAQDRQ